MSATTDVDRPRSDPTKPSRRLERDLPRLTGRAAALVVVVVFLALMAVVPARQFLAQRGRIAELERRTAELEQSNADLRSEVERLHDPAELERLARECLGMVAPGEVAFVTPGQAPSKAC
ncbi:MAG TPA: septum formation initiator family protein [Actinomycetota bacterium]|nr:septum formation initiator family protein [Actinomycetota bacterium]